MKSVVIILSFLFLFIDYQELRSQNIFSGFLKLSGPEKCWTLEHLFVAAKAFRITCESRKITNEILVNHLLDEYPAGGKVDAFRHTYWMARLTQKIGEKKARSLGIAHEKGNYKFFLKNKYEDEVIPDSVSGIMDLKNNEEGISLGKTNQTADPDKIKTDVIRKIHSGGCFILKRNGEGKLVSCADEIVIQEKKIWAVPYCIVKSDQ